MNRLFDKVSDVTAAEGQVQIDGPDGIAFALTPDAAAMLAQRLATASAEARDQTPARPTERGRA